MSWEGASSIMSNADAVEAVIRKRRSFGLKDLKPDDISSTLVAQVLGAAQWAPNHGHTEPWRFTVFRGAGRHRIGEAFAEAYRLAAAPGKFDAVAQEIQRQRVWQAPVWISVGLLAGTNPKIPEVEELLAVGSAVQNMLLLATAFGLGSKWTTGAAATHAHTAATAGLDPPARLLGFVYLGWPAIPWPEGTHARLTERVAWVED